MNEIKNYGYIGNLELYEYITFPTYIIIILLISYSIQQKNIQQNFVYKYYTRAVLVKILGAVSFCLVYIFVYKGGDTIAYFESARAFTKLLFHNPASFFKIITEAPSAENFYLFDGRTTGFPWRSMYFDTKTFFVIKMLIPFMAFSFQSYLLTTILFSWVSFIGIWRLYLMFTELYNKLHFQLAISILFIPSVIFWGSGILKDTITLSASCWFIYALYCSMIKKNKNWKSFLTLVVSGFVIFSIKPYILFALLPGVFIWVLYERIVKIHNKLLKYSIIPFVYLLSFIAGYAVLTAIGDFDIQELINEASVKQNDLKRVEYKGNSFDIGSYEPTIDGALKVSPSALLAGLFRPYLWEAKNIVMIFSGIENMFYIGLTLIIILRMKFIKLFRILFENPLVLFCLSYSILFALIVGLSTSNFGALVRFKIAFLPELLSALFILNYYMGRKTESNEKS